jgi:V/A-type H+-transporting ATPase subunit C
LRQHGGDIGVALSYLYLKETDIKNIIMIIEGVRYALPTREIASFLIGYGGGARSAVPA